MNIVFRTDASVEIGTGHVMRGLTIAKSLRDRNCNCTFICREHEGNLIEKITSEGFKASVLENSKFFEIENDQPILDHTDWLGTSWQQDAIQSIEAIGSDRIDWLVVDHYALDKRWEEKLRPYTKKIMVIDDLADREHSCDLLLDQNLIADLENRYKSMVGESCVTLLGPQYALLQDEFIHLIPTTPPRIGKIKKILIFFGGSDLHNLTGLAIEAFLMLKRNDIMLDVVISDKNPSFNSIKEQTKEHGYITLHNILPSLAPLMQNADLAIGAGGATSWERCCLGLPCIVVTVAENQKPIANELQTLGLVKYIGHYDSLCAESLIDELEIILSDDSLEAWSKSCMEKVDGLGAQRVSGLLTLSESSRLKAQMVSVSDEDLLFRWVKDHQILNNETSSQGFTYQTFKLWFYKKLKDSEYFKFFIIHSGDSHLPLSLVLFEKKDGVWVLDFYVEKACQFIEISTLLESAISKFRAEQKGNLAFLFSERSRENFHGLSIKHKSKKWKHDPLALAICTDQSSWINDSIPKLIIEWLSIGHSCCWSHDAALLDSGDLCFYLSYGDIVDSKILKKFKNNLVVHESDLPKGKGWSPLTWQIIEGKQSIPVTLFEAAEKVDSGQIYDQRTIKYRGDELVDELREKQAKISYEMCSDFVSNYPEVLTLAIPQQGTESVYSRRNPEHSELNPTISIMDQFNLLRVVDNKEYPAFFRRNGQKYYIKISKTYE